MAKGLNRVPVRETLFPYNDALPIRSEERRVGKE